jgi:hypothetical protein
MISATLFNSGSKRLLMAFLMASSIVAIAMEAEEPRPWETTVGAAWRVTFLPGESILNCEHASSGASIGGKLSFRVINGEKVEQWGVVLPRDSVTNRLALLDTRGNVQGYLTISGSGSALTIRPIHRAAQNYHGELRLEAQATLGARTFACRTQPTPQSRVVQMASGPARPAVSSMIPSSIPMPTPCSNSTRLPAPSHWRPRTRRRPSST